jgi:hypothetical protein
MSGKPKKQAPKKADVLDKWPEICSAKEWLKQEFEKEIKAKKPAIDQDMIKDNQHGMLDH